MGRGRAARHSGGPVVSPREAQYAETCDKQSHQVLWQRTPDLPVIRMPGELVKDSGFKVIAPPVPSSLPRDFYSWVRGEVLNLHF